MWREPAIVRRRLRECALVLHRYVGLSIAVFLLVVGLTGSILAFQEPLDVAINPSLFRVSPPNPGAEMLEGVELAERVRKLAPQAPEIEAKFNLESGQAATFWAPLPSGEYRELFVNPYTGALLGSREWGNLSEGMINLIPFIYRLHYSLALGEMGSLLLGIVALLWTIDSFVGAYLTLPSRSHRSSGVPRWLKRWLPAWFVKTKHRFALVFTFHRASGLWLWTILLVFAWSAVGLNLQPVYRPVMEATVGMAPKTRETLPTIAKPYSEPSLSIRDAHALARRHMAVELERRGQRLERELGLRYAADHGVYVYRVESTLDVSAKYPRTEIYLDGNSGLIVGFDVPTGGLAGGSITTWINALHFADVGGVWYRVIVLILGLAIAGLSVTGVWVWWRKRTKRASRLRDRERPPPRPA